MGGVVSRCGGCGARAYTLVHGRALEGSFSGVGIDCALDAVLYPRLRIYTRENDLRTRTWTSTPVSVSWGLDNFQLLLNSFKHQPNTNPAKLLLQRLAHRDLCNRNPKHAVVKSDLLKMR